MQISFLSSDFGFTESLEQRQHLHLFGDVLTLKCHEIVPFLTDGCEFSYMFFTWNYPAWELSSIFYTSSSCINVAKLLIETYIYILTV
jgi:hypothetical protein